VPVVRPCAITATELADKSQPSIDIASHGQAARNRSPPASKARAAAGTRRKGPRWLSRYASAGAQDLVLAIPAAS